MKIRFALHAILFFIAYAPAYVSAQTAPAVGVQQFASFGDFKLQNGAIIRDFRIGYRTLGKLNADSSNAILWPTWLGGRSEDLLQFVGPKSVVDPNSYFVILVDAIGNGVSTSPSNSKRQPFMQFPRFTIRDMVEAEHRLVTDVLHLGHLRAVMGISMGGMQTFEWLVAYPNFMDEAIPMLGSPQSTSFDKLLWTTEIDALELDPDWNRGSPRAPLTRGAVLLEEIDSMNITSPAYRVAHTTSASFNAFLKELRGSSKADIGTASDQIRQRQAIISFDIPGEYGLTLEQTAKRERAKLLVIVSPQDHMVNPAPARQFAATINAPVVILDSPCGHLSLSCISVGPVVASFLKDPESVQSETLQDRGNR
jgi:homoserine O-acetyltransferase/O-succinyltransferase